jgi:hypothetical protein
MRVYHHVLVALKNIATKWLMIMKKLNMYW